MTDLTTKEAALATAKELYMQFLTISQIAQKTGIPRTTIQYHVTSRWKDERAIFSSELLSGIAENKRSALTQIASRSLELMARALEDIAKKPELSAYDAQTMAVLFEKLDKIMKLDDGAATDIIGNTKPATIIEIQKRLSVDPFRKALGVDTQRTDDENDSINLNSIDDSSDECCPDEPSANQQ